VRVNTHGLARCPDCGALVPDVDGPTHAYIGASAGCWGLWGELQARAVADPSMAAVMPLAVDAYAAQHPGAPGRRQAQSAIVHLVSICLVLEHGLTPVEGIRAKQVLLVDDPVFDWLEPPPDPGPVTVLDLSAERAADPARVVRTWAETVWQAWSAHHRVIRPLATEVLRRMGR
jgi:hypothetical protein